MPSLHYTEEAILDLDRIYAFWAFERENRSYADRLLDGIRNSIDILTLFPSMGVARDGWERGLRALVHDDHVILYVYDEEAHVVLIRNVLNGRQDIGSRFLDDESEENGS